MVCNGTGAYYGGNDSDDNCVYGYASLINTRLTTAK